MPRLVDDSRRTWAEFESQGVSELRTRVLTYIAKNRRPDFGAGAYSYIPGGPPILYASCYAALTRHLFSDLGSLSNNERTRWANYIQTFQQSDGLFRDPVIDCPWANEWLSWGWRHLTIHAVAALSALDSVAARHFGVLDEFRPPGAISRWLRERRWHEDAANVSNEIQNVATLLQYARDFQDEHWCNNVLDELFCWLDREQNPETGYWGYGVKTAHERSQGVQTGYHLWLLYFYDRRPLQYVEQIIDSCLATQNPLGGFGPELNSSACEDIDSIDPLVRLSGRSPYRRDEIESVLARAVPWVIANLNSDGSGVFRRGEAFRYGHDLMYEKRDQGSMFPTWFRALSLAYLAQVLGAEVVTTGQVDFIDCPGVQFWRTSTH